MIDEATAARFWSKVDVRGVDECWPRAEGLNNGYPVMRVGGKSRRAFLASKGEGVR